MVVFGHDLLPGERLLWEGRPLRHRLFRAPDVWLIPFSLCWFGLILSWEATALGITGPGPSPAAAVGLPFVLFGLYLTVGRFVVRAVVSRRTRYVVTDRRLLVLGGGFSGDRTVAQYLTALPPPVIKETPDGSGSLAFGAFPSLADVFTGNRQRRPALWSGEFSVTPVLRHISDVRRVRDLIAEAQHTGAR